MKKNKDIKKKTEDNVSIDEDENIGKKLKISEDHTLLWVLIIIGIIFASVLIPYFWAESNKSFSFEGIDWIVEDYDNLKIFHGRFISLTNSNLYYNAFLRVDPRKNNVEVVGDIDDFWNEGFISLSPEVDACRGDLGRGIFDLSAFLRQGVGISSLKSGSTDEITANQSGRVFVNCDNAVNITLVIVNISSEGKSKVSQDKENPSCYIITASDCEDVSGIEKFIVRSVVDFKNRYPEKK